MILSIVPLLAGGGLIDAIFWSVEEIAAKASNMYANGIQQQVETPDNIGKMLTIDVETGEYFIDKSGVEGMMFLKAKRHSARLFTLRICYSAAFGFGGLEGKLN
jgi:hypothetical protein